MESGTTCFRSTTERPGCPTTAMAAQAANTFPGIMAARTRAAARRRVSKSSTSRKQLQRKLERDQSRIRRHRSRPEPTNDRQGGARPAAPRRRRQPRARRGSRREELLRFDPRGKWPFPGRNPRQRMGLKGRQVRRDVGIERAHRAHEAERGTPRRGQISPGVRSRNPVPSDWDNAVR